MMEKDTSAFLKDKRGAALTADNTGKCGEYMYEETICSAEFPQGCIDSESPKPDAAADVE